MPRPDAADLASRPTPLSATRTSNESRSMRAAISIVPAALRPLNPCRIAFSTSGCNTNRGTRQSTAASST
jgi:hypothetical protein